MGLSLASPIASASYAKNCLFYGKYPAHVSQDATHYRFEFTVLHAMTLKYSHDTCEQYKGSTQRISLSKEDFAQVASQLKRNKDYIFIKRASLSDKGGVHQNRFTYVGRDIP